MNTAEAGFVTAATGGLILSLIFFGLRDGQKESPLDDTARRVVERAMSGPFDALSAWLFEGLVGKRIASFFYTLIILVGAIIGLIMLLAGTWMLIASRA